MRTRTRQVNEAYECRIRVERESCEDLDKGE